MRLPLPPPSVPQVLGVDDFACDHLRERRAAEPAVPVLQLFREIKELGYTGSLNLLYRYITQGRAEGDRPVITPRRLARLLLTRPDRLREADTTLLQELAVICPEPAQLARLVSVFAELLTPAAGNDAKLAAWLTDARPLTCPTCTASPTALSSTARLSTPEHGSLVTWAAVGALPGHATRRLRTASDAERPGSRVPIGSTSAAVFRSSPQPVSPVAVPRTSTLSFAQRALSLRRLPRCAR